LRHIAEKRQDNPIRRRFEARAREAEKQAEVIRRLLGKFTR
jgi:hypothetical protein